MAKSYDKKVILLKAETTEGTDAAPAVATNALRVLDYQPTFMDAEQKVRNIEKAYFGADPVAMAAFKRGASFNLEMHGSGAAGTVPQWMKVLEFAGFDAGTVSAGVSVIQKPTSDIKSATHWAYIDDLLLKTIGARASVGFTIEDDEFPQFNVTLLGRPPATSLAEEAVPGAVTLVGVTDPILASSENTTFTLDGYAVALRRWTMNANVDLQYRSLIGPSDRVMARERNWNGQIVCEVPSLAAKNYFEKVRPGTTMPASAVHGVAAGNIVQVDTPKLQITGNIEMSEEQGQLMMTMPVTALPVAGNDEIVFTAK